MKKSSSNDRKHENVSGFHYLDEGGDDPLAVLVPHGLEAELATDQTTPRRPLFPISPWPWLQFHLQWRVLIYKKTIP